MKTTQLTRIKDLIKNLKNEKILPANVLGEISQIPFLSNNFPLGSNCSFIYSRAKSKFLFIDEESELVFSFKSNEILEMNPRDFFTKIAEDSHHEAVFEIFELSFDFCRKNCAQKQMVFNLEYNIRTIEKIKKRLVCQWIPITTDENDYPDVIFGYYTDITHFKKDGLPVLYVVADKKLIYTEEAKPETIIRSKNIPFTKRQVEILRLMSSGFSAKEVAQKMNLSVATVYTQSKLIKNKTGMDIKAALKYLDDKGLI